MNQYKLGDIAMQIVKNSFQHEEWYVGMEQELDEMYKNVDIIGPNNISLRNPLNLDESVFIFRNRENPLTGQEMVTGDYLVFKYIGHNGEMFIDEYNSIAELEEEITGGGGITNPFITYQIPIIMGSVRQYNITFVNKIDGKEYDFVKGVHDMLSDFDFEEEQPAESALVITNVKICWLNP